jgi:hypothetical protein
MQDFLLFDAAKAGKNLHKAIALNAANQSLYKGGPNEALHGVAPHLFTLEFKRDFKNWFVKEGWGNAWGLIVKTPVTFEELAKHLCKFLIIKTERNEKLYFRFYDPRVLRVFLPTCDKEQLKEFFGPVKMFIMEDEDPAYTLQFWLQNYELVFKRVPASELLGEIMPAKEVQQLTTSPVAEKQEGKVENGSFEILPAETKKKRRFF